MTNLQFLSVISDQSPFFLSSLYTNVQKCFFPQGQSLLSAKNDTSFSSCLLALHSY